jgi:hypothetical protein
LTTRWSEPEPGWAEAKPSERATEVASVSCGSDGIEGAKAVKAVQTKELREAKPFGCFNQSKYY